MIKIVYIINYILKNGPSKVVLNLIDNLDKSKYDISLITLFKENDEEVLLDLINKNVNIYECKTINRIECLYSQPKEFLNIIENDNFDIIHTHGIIPDILSSRLKTKAKRITTIHNNMYEDYLYSYGFLKSRIFISMHLSALKKLDECVCCSKSIYEVLIKHLSNVSFIRNGIEPVKAKTVVTRKDINIPDDAFIFIYVGALSLRKNIVWLVENFVKYHKDNEYLVILGSGEKEKECKAKADDHIRLLGYQSDPIAYMNISDIYVSASKSEGFSVSVLEALSCGLGLFLSDISSHCEVIEMSKGVNLGEFFSYFDFFEKFSIISKFKIDKSKIIEFQDLYLSAKIMSDNYSDKYLNLLNLYGDKKK